MQVLTFGLVLQPTSYCAQPKALCSGGWPRAVQSEVWLPTRGWVQSLSIGQVLQNITKGCVQGVLAPRGGVSAGHG